MGLLAWLRQGADQVTEAAISPALVATATDMVVRLTNPRLTLIRRYRQRLAPAVEASIRYLREQAAGLPPTREATRASWSSDPAIHAYFATADDLPVVFSRSKELRAYFESKPELEQVHAVLGMQMIQQRVMGLALEGEVVRREVPQTTVSFGDHKIRIFGQTEQELRREIGMRIFEQFALIALARIAAAQTRRKELQYNRALLKTKLKVLSRQGTGLTALSAEAAQDQELARLQRRLDDNERELRSSTTAADALEHDLEVVRSVLAAPAESVRISTLRLCLTPLNVVAEGEAARQGRDIETGMAWFGAAPPVERAFGLVRFPRAELLPAGIRFAEAESLLGRVDSKY